MAAVVALAVALGVLAWRNRPRGVVPPVGSSTVTGWDETSSPSPPDTPSPSGSGRPAVCDQPAANKLPQPAGDKRVHGGPLSTPVLPGWRGPSPEYRVPLGRDAYAMRQKVAEETELGWESSVTLGVIADDGADARTTAELMMQCVVTSDFYYSVDATLGEPTVRSTTVDGTQATQVDAVISFDDPRLRTKGSSLRVIVVRTAPLTFYFSAVPKERDDLRKAVDKATDDLRID